MIRSAASFLVRDRRGTSTVELAMVAPFFAMLVMGTVDASRAVSEKMRLQQAAARSIEMASAGGINSPAFTNLGAEAAAAAGVSAQNVTVTPWLECDRSAPLPIDNDCAPNQEIGRYVSVSIRGNYTPWFASSLAGLGWDVSRAIRIEGQASVRLQ